MLKEGKGEPLDLMQKYYGESMSAYDDFLNNVSLEASSPRDLATRILREVELIPQFAMAVSLGSWRYNVITVFKFKKYSFKRIT